MVEWTNISIFVLILLLHAGGTEDMQHFSYLLIVAPFMNLLPVFLRFQWRQSIIKKLLTNNLTREIEYTYALYIMEDMLNYSSKM